MIYTGLLLRLSGGSSYHEGRVEVNYNYEWGTVCDDGWDDADAGVVCRQLGFGSSGIAIKSTEYGQGSGNKWPNIVLCNGSEPNLARCGINVTTSCRHTKNARVSCRGLKDTQGACVHRLFSCKIICQMYGYTYNIISDCMVFDNQRNCYTRLIPIHCSCNTYIQSCTVYT